MTKKMSYEESKSTSILLKLCIATLLSLTMVLGVMPIIMPSSTTTVYASTGVYYNFIQVRGSQLVLDVSGGKRSNGARILLWARHGGANQQWRFERQPSGAYKIRSVHSGKLLEVRGASRQSGAQVIQWADNNSLHQQWFVRSVGGGYYELINANSQMALDVTWGRIQAGTYMQQHPHNSTVAQQFRFIPTNNQATGTRTFSLARYGRNYRLGPNFTLGEFASRCGADTVTVYMPMIQKLQQIRAHFGNRPVIVNSGFRTVAHNRNVGGVANSLHTRGRAADIQIHGVSPTAIASFARQIGFTEVIVYSSGFVHVGIR